MNSSTENGIAIPSLDGLFGSIALGLIGLSGVLFVAEALGFLPNGVTKWLNRNRLSQTLDILEAFGIDVDGARRRNRAATLDQTPGNTILKRTEATLARYKIAGPVAVGQTMRLTADHYHDLMGASCNPTIARAIARDLTAHWRRVITDPSETATDEFDFVVTPKGGAPLLGAAFAELVRKPFVLHAGEPKFEGGDKFRALFDCDEKPKEGARALIVDDSSTGGGKAIRLINDLRDLGYRVDDLLVVFEPQLKTAEGASAAQRLQPLGVRLHSIVET